MGFILYSPDGKRFSRSPPVRRERKVRLDHKPSGDPCEKCKFPAHQHRVRAVRDRTGKPPSPRRLSYFGIDGEGQGRTDHKYVYLACCDESGERVFELENQNGITTEQALNFLLGIPAPINKTRVFAYSFNYDLTKMLTDLPNGKLYKLFRPELRKRPGKDAVKGPKPVIWKGFSLNLQGTKFTVSKRGVRRVIWDIWKFYQSKFVNACDDWKVGTQEERDLMRLMKNKRHLFDQMSFEEVKAYCQKECTFMGELGRKLVEAHQAVKLELHSFYGAGSSGGAMLKAMGIQERIRGVPPAMKEAVACAFVGGRFENSVIGEIEGPVYNLDISSAYPYQLCFLPCLKHGTWERTKERKDLETCLHALVKYGLNEANISITNWAPFPFRTADGSICFPIESGGGWVYKDEYLAGENIFSHVEFREAWIYKSKCSCQPFAQIPNYYCERIRIGKEGPGIVIKLGVNSCYGKLAQSVGNALFNSWLWAGMITSGCRAQVLQLMGLHKDRSNLLMIATDGVYSREHFGYQNREGIWVPSTGYPIPQPSDTGTNHTGKPLGGWETTPVERGVFIARPGIYFPLSPSEKDLKSVKGRGVGKGTILENWQKIISTWNANGIFLSDGELNKVHVANVSRFCGAKTSISKSSKGFKRANGDHEGKAEPAYGQWVERVVQMGFHPMPKRSGVNPDGKTLTLRKMPRDLESCPYNKAMVSPEALELKIGQQELEEQPDVDLAEYE